MFNYLWLTSDSGSLLKQCWFCCLFLYLLSLASSLSLFLFYSRLKRIDILIYSLRMSHSIYDHINYPTKLLPYHPSSLASCSLSKQQIKQQNCGVQCLFADYFWLWDLLWYSWYTQSHYIEETDFPSFSSNELQMPSWLGWRPMPTSPPLWQILSGLIWCRSCPCCQCLIFIWSSGLLYLVNNIFYNNLQQKSCNIS